MSLTLTGGVVILVTAASGAIGLEIAAQAAASRAVVASHGLGSASVSVAMERLIDRVPGAKLIAAPADFRDKTAIETMVRHVVSEAGRLDAVIHCGIIGASGVAGTFAKADPSGFGRHAALILGSFQRVFHAVIPHLAERGGTIVRFASDAGRFVASRQTVIGAAFGAIVTFVRNLSVSGAARCACPLSLTQICPRNTGVRGACNARRGREGSLRTWLAYASRYCADGAVPVRIGGRNDLRASDQHQWRNERLNQLRGSVRCSNDKTRKRDMDITAADYMIAGGGSAGSVFAARFSKPGLHRRIVQLRAQ